MVAVYNLVLSSGPSHGYWGTALHQLWDTGLPVWIDHKFGSEYLGQITWGRRKRHFPAVYRSTTVLGHTTGLPALGEAPSSNHKLTQDFQNFWKRSLCFGKKERLKTQSTHSTNTFLSSIYTGHSFSPPDQLLACGDDFQCQPTAQRMGLHYLVQPVNQWPSGRSSVCKYWLSAFSHLYYYYYCYCIFTFVLFTLSVKKYVFPFWTDLIFVTYTVNITRYCCSLYLSFPDQL